LDHAFYKKLWANESLRSALGEDTLVKEDEIAKEWRMYYVLSARVLTREEVIDERMQNFGSIVDVNNKSGIGFKLSHENWAERAQLLGVPVTGLRDLHLSWIASVVGELLQAEIDMKKDREWQWKEYGKKEKEIKEKMASGETESGFSLNLAMSPYRYAVSSSTYRIRTCGNQVENIERKLVANLLRYYPNKGGEVRTALMKAGYNTGEKCRDVLLRTVGYGKSNAYLYHGLPPPPKKEDKPKTKK